MAEANAQHTLPVFNQVPDVCPEIFKPALVAVRVVPRACDDEAVVLAQAAIGVRQLAHDAVEALPCLALFAAVRTRSTRINCSCTSTPSKTLTRAKNP